MLFYIPNFLAKFISDNKEVGMTRASQLMLQVFATADKDYCALGSSFPSSGRCPFLFCFPLASAVMKQTCHVAGGRVICC